MRLDDNLPAPDKGGLHALDPIRTIPGRFKEITLYQGIAYGPPDQLPPIDNALGSGPNRCRRSWTS